MSDFDALMRPFEPFLDARWKRRLWGVLLAAAPLALTAGFWIHGQQFRQPGFRMLIDRDRAVEIAREAARAHGLETAGWRERVRFEIRPATMAYFRAHDVGEQLRVRRFLPEAVAEVMLLQPAQRLWVRQGASSPISAPGVEGSGRRPRLFPRKCRARRRRRKSANGWAGWQSASCGSRR